MLNFFVRSILIYPFTLQKTRQMLVSLQCSANSMVKKNDFLFPCLGSGKLSGWTRITTSSHIQQWDGLDRTYSTCALSYTRRAVPSGVGLFLPMAVLHSSLPDSRALSSKFQSVSACGHLVGRMEKWGARHACSIANC